MSKFMYGVEFLREYNPDDPDHVARQDRMCELPSGPKLLADAFDCILARVRDSESLVFAQVPDQLPLQGVKVKESSVFTRKYCTEVTSLATLSVFEVEIWCYRGGTSTPMWINRQAEDFTTLCIVQADLSLLAGSAQSKPGRLGKTYWTIVFSVEIHFGLTEFKARIKWVDGVSPLVQLIHQLLTYASHFREELVSEYPPYCYIHSDADATSSGPASIIYNEGGQRAEEDDLDDDDPVPSAYVSRAPSPPAFDSHLPVPEKSYLEVPNATNSVHSSKSRDPPPELDVVDKGKRREGTTSGTGPSRSMSLSRGVPSGIEIPGPIARTDSNSSRISGSGRIGDALTSVWGNNPPSAGPSANSSVLPSPLEGPTTRSAILNALQPLASVPEGSAIPEVIHADAGADTGAQTGIFEAYRSEPPKTPKAETPRPSASPSRIPVAGSAVATSPKPPATPKAASRIPTASVSPRTGGTPRGLSIYSNGSQPPAVATPRGSAFGGASPGHVSPPADGAPPEPPANLPEQGAAQGELQAVRTPKSLSRAPTKPPTRVASPQPLPPAPEPEIITPQPIEPAASNTEAESHIPVTEPEPPAAAVPEQPEPAAAEEDWFVPQVKSKAGSRKGSKAASKVASKAASKAATPKGAQTPRPESTAEAESASAPQEVPVAGGANLPSSVPSPLATVPEDPIPEVVIAQGDPTPEAPHEQSGLPGGFFTTNPDVPEAAPPAPALVPAPTQGETASLSGFGSVLSGGAGEGLIGAATSAFSSWGFGKSKASTPKVSTPVWGSRTPSAAEPAPKPSPPAWGSRAPSATESAPKPPPPGWGSRVPSATGSAGGGGWGSATGNNSRSNSEWFGMEQTTGSVNASTADLFSGSNANPTLGQDPADTTESQLPSFAPETLLAETQGEGAFQEGIQGEGAPQEETPGEHAPQEETHNREHLTLMTDVPVVADAATAGPTTAGDSPEGGEGGGEAEGGEGAAEKPFDDDEWGLPVKKGKNKNKGGAKEGTNAGTPVTPNAGTGGDDWATATTVKGKKKKGGKR